MLVSFMFSLMLLKGELDEIVPRQLIIRSASLAEPPPPPPPAQQQPREQEIEMRLDVSGDGPAIAISQVPIEETIKNIELQPPDMDSLSARLDLSLDVDWSAFTLDELDENPVLLTDLETRFPRSLRERGIESVLVRLDIFIDESGQPTLISILQNDYPELEEPINEMIGRARFTSPKRGGLIVRARFILPMEFRS